MVDTAGKEFSPEMARCIDDCTRMHQVALTAAGHALRHGGGESTNHIIRVLSDCVEMCQTAANFMLRGSPNHKTTCGVNAEICREVAEECGKFDDDVMNKVVEAAERLDPDLLVHLVYAESAHLERLADRRVPVAVCPRSNLVTGVGLPPVLTVVTDRLGVLTHFRNITRGVLDLRERIRTAGEDQRKDADFARAFGSVEAFLESEYDLTHLLAKRAEAETCPRGSDMGSRAKSGYGESIVK